MGIYVDSIGVTFTLHFEEDISDATAFYIYLNDLNGTGSLGSDNRSIIYTTTSGELGQAGILTIQGHASGSTVSLYSDRSYVLVRDNLANLGDSLTEVSGEFVEPIPESDLPDNPIISAFDLGPSLNCSTYLSFGSTYVSGTIDDELDGWSYVFQYSLADANSWSTPTVLSSGDNYRIFSLSVDTGYDLRVVATTGVDTLYSDSFRLNTLPDPLLSAQDLLTGSGVRFLIRDVEVDSTNTIAVSGSGEASWIYVASGLIGETSIDINSFVAESGYYARIISTTDNKCDRYSPIISFSVQTLSGDPPEEEPEAPPPEPIVLPVISASDEFLRCIVVAGQFFWFPDLYPEYATNREKSFKSLLTYGVKYNYTYGAEPTRVSANGDAYYGTATSAESGAGLTGVRDVYLSGYLNYRSEFPDCVVGTYIGSLSLQTRARMLTTAFWPTQAALIDDFLPACTGAVLPTSPNNDAIILITDDTCRDLSVDIHNDIAWGNVGRFRTQLLHYDEVGWTTAWDDNVERFTRLKADHNASGVLLSATIGGYNLIGVPRVGLGGIPGLGQNTMYDIPLMCDSMTSEGPWNYNPSISAYGFRTKVLTENIIGTMRTIMNQGTNIELLPVLDAHSCVKLTITNCVESDGNTKLHITLNRPHKIFPHSGYITGRVQLQNLPAAYSGLSAYSWTPEQVPGQPNQLKLTPSTSLATIKTTEGYSTNISFTSGEAWDMQSSIRMLAGLAMMARRPGDKVCVHFAAIHNTYPGDGTNSDPDNWFYWPLILGAPTSDYIISSTGAAVPLSSNVTGYKNWQGVPIPSTDNPINSMYRNFENGVITVYPVSGYVEVSV